MNLIHTDSDLLSALLSARVTTCRIRKNSSEGKNISTTLYLRNDSDSRDSFAVHNLL